MRLSRIVPLCLGLVFLMLFAGIITVAVANSRQYLEAQLQTHAQDTATFLGVALSTSARGGDVATAEALLSAVFDRGYYREITLKNNAGQVLITRSQMPLAADVPHWFVEALPLKAPAALALVMDGWRQLGQIEVASHTGQAYVALWHIALQAGALVGGVSLAAFVLAVAALHLALSPLRPMTRLAEDISRRRFGRLPQVPWALELRVVTRALNDMSVKVEAMLAHQTRAAHTMRKQAYEDELTGLPNRRSLMDRLQHWARSEEEFRAGALALVELSGFGAFNARFGRKAGDAVLREAAARLRALFQDAEPVILARANGAEFAVIVADADPVQAEALGARIVGALAVPERGGIHQGPIAVCVGIACTTSLSSATLWLAAADGALLRAHDRGAGYWQVEAVREQAGAAPPGAEQWRAALDTALRARALVLQIQPIRWLVPGLPEHGEALARVAAGDGTLLPAGLFMPLVREGGLARELDQQVCTQALARLRARPEGTETLAINLCVASLEQADFVTWLQASLQASPGLARRLIIELPERELLREVARLEPVLARIAALGPRWAVDRFGHEAAALALLRRIDLAYIKIDGSYIRGLPENADGRFFVQTLAGVAHGLGVLVVAESVESAAELDLLAGLGVDAAQGHHIGRPA